MKTVNVRVKYGGRITACDCGSLSPAVGDWAVVRDDELVFLGQVVSAPAVWPDGFSQAAERCGLRPRRPALSSENRGYENQPTENRRPYNRKLLRLADEADLARQAENGVREREAFDYCLTRAAAQRLEMQLAAVEVLFDGSKTIFYYTAEDRVDFRQLVKELVSRFRTRIEMRQIGVRQKARLIGGLGGCGRPFCCSGFLADFAPVSVKMAKEQSVSLNPAKISGVCGRLLCCLAFERQAERPRARKPGAVGEEPDCPADDVSGSET